MADLRRGAAMRTSTTSDFGVGTISRMSIGGPMVGAIDLFKANHSLLGGPVELEVEMRSEFQIGQFSKLGNRLDVTT